MCKCNAKIRTPFCGGPGCEWPQICKSNMVERFREQMSNGVPKIDIVNSMKKAGYTHNQIASVLECTKKSIDRSVARYNKSQKVINKP